MEEENNVKKRRKKSFKHIFKHKFYRMRNLYCLVCFILSLIACFMVFNTGIFPYQYLLLLFLILVFFIIIGFILINVHRKNVLKGMGYLLLSILSIFCITLLFYVNTIDKFFDNNFNENSHIYLENTYYILGDHNTKYSDDMMTGNIGVFYKTYNLLNVFHKVNDKYSFNPIEYHDLTQMFEDYKNHTISFVLMDKSLYEIYFSLSNDRKNDYGILDSFHVYSKKDRTNSLNKEKYNIYLKVLSDEGFNDLNVIVSVNHKENKILFTYISEDSYLPVFNQSDKLKYMDVYGTNTTKSVLESLLNMDIDYTLTFSESKLSHFIDYLGGIKYCSDEGIEIDSLSMNRLKINEGCNKIDGEEALTLSQYKEDRLNHNINITLGILDEVFNINTLKRFNGTLNTFGNTIDTDLSQDVITHIIRSGLNQNKWSVEKQSIDGVISRENISLSLIEDDVVLLDSNSIHDASLKIQDILK